MNLLKAHPHNKKKGEGRQSLSMKTWKHNTNKVNVKKNNKKQQKSN